MISSRLLRICLGGLFIFFACNNARAQQIAFTWDDVPAHGPLPAGELRLGIGHRIIEAMQAQHLPPAYGFVNGVAIEREPDSAPMLKDWRDAGFPLGNHTWSHMNLNTASLEDWEADVLKNEPVLEKYAAGSDWHWLRYPFLAEGDTPEKRAAARQFLAAHRYRIAAVTMSFGDYMWNEPYARCVAKKRYRRHRAARDPVTLTPPRADADFRRAHGENALRARHSLRAADACRRIRCPHAAAPPRALSEQRLHLRHPRGGREGPVLQQLHRPHAPAGPDLLEAAMQARGLPMPPRPKLALDLDSLCR